MAGQIGKKIASLRAELSHLFDQVLTDLFVPEEDIHRAYNRDLDDDEKPLVDKLQRLNTSLATFIAQEFPDRYHYIPDKVKPTFVRVDVIRSDGPPAITAPPSSHNTSVMETSSTHQKSLSPEFSSQHKRSLEQQHSADFARGSTKSPPQHASQFGPVGSGRATDAERHSGFTPPPGFSKIRAPGTTDRSDPRSQYSHSFSTNYTVDYPPSNSSSRTPSIPPPVEPFADFGALSSRFERLSTNEHAVYYDTNDDSAERALNNRQAKFAQQMEDYGLMEQKKGYPTDADNENAVGQSGTFAEIMEPQERVTHNGQQPSEQAMYEVDDLNASNEIIDLTPLASVTSEVPNSVELGTAVELNKPQAFRQSPPIHINRPQAVHAQVDNAPAPSGMKTINETTSVGQNSAARHRISSTVTEPMDDHVAISERNRMTSSRRTQYDTLTANQTQDVSLNQQKLFYHVSQGSITNCGEVRIYRAQNYGHLQNIEPKLYDPIPDILKELAIENESLGPLIHTLQEIDYLYSDGMTANELATIDHVLSEDKDDLYFGRRTSVMSIIECVDLGLILYRSGSFFVREEIRDICLWHLPRGLTSNLYRLLACESISLIQDVARHSGILFGLQRTTDHVGR
ncbi:hypothetical protein M3Y94_01305500 [Aphelenchoides besseyi]|nr:hypothetical protein M3Y94_01305500 [Aphelenchoides besseyi]